LLATLLLGDVGLIIALARIMGGIFSQIPFAFD